MSREVVTTGPARSAQDFLALPPAERQQIAVMSDSKAKAIAAKRERDLKDADHEQSPESGDQLHAAIIGAGGTLGKTAASAVGLGGVVGAAAAGSRVGALAGLGGMVVGAGLGGAGYLGYRYMKGKSTPGVPVSIRVAQHLPFDGVPRENTFYVCHPRKNLYIPLADFHREVFQDKVREAHDVFREMGATRIEVDVKEGYKLNLAAKLGIPKVGGLEGGGHKKQEAGFRILSEFPGSQVPRIDPGDDPNTYCWYPLEKEWQQVYRDRVQSQLQRREVTIGYSDDYGVNAKLKAEVEGASLDIGGSFTNFKNTSWHWKVEFPPAITAR